MAGLCYSQKFCQNSAERKLVLMSDVGYDLGIHQISQHTTYYTTANMFEAILKIQSFFESLDIILSNSMHKDFAQTYITSGLMR